MLNILLVEIIPTVVQFLHSVSWDLSELSDLPEQFTMELSQSQTSSWNNMLVMLFTGSDLHCFTVSSMHSGKTESWQAGQSSFPGSLKNLWSQRKCLLSFWQQHILSSPMLDWHLAALSSKCVLLPRNIGLSIFTTDLCSRIWLH